MQYIVHCIQQSVIYYFCNGDDDGQKNIKKAVGLINNMTTCPVHHIFGTCLCYHYISMLRVKFDLRLKLFYLCWFFNFLCLLGLEDKQTYESTCNLGQKVLRIFTFLTTESLSHGFGGTMALLPTPHPGQSSLVWIRKDPAGLQRCFFGGKGEYLQLPVLSRALSWN